MLSVRLMVRHGFFELPCADLNPNGNAQMLLSVVAWIACFGRQAPLFRFAQRRNLVRIQVFFMFSRGLFCTMLFRSSLFLDLSWMVLVPLLQLQ